MSSPAAAAAPASLPQATIEQTIRTSKSLLWGVSIALSWTWGLGLFFSVQIAVQFGLQGLVSFALANATGLALFGLYTARIAARSGSAAAFERRFLEGARQFRGAIFFYQFLAIALTMFALLKYLVVPVGVSIPLTLLVLFSVTFFLGEEFDISRIRYSHAFFGIGIFIAAAGLLWGLLHILLPAGGDGASVLTLDGAWRLAPDAENLDDITYYLYYMVPVVVGFLVGPWLDLQQWQRAIQIRREELSITGSYVCGAIIFFAILIFHGFLALSVWNGTGIAASVSRDGLFHAKDVIVRFFLAPDSGVGVFFGFYIAFLCFAIVTTLDSGYIALRWFTGRLLEGSSNILFSIVPPRYFSSPLPWFFAAAALAVGGVFAGLELEYLMAFYGSFLVAYQIVFLRRMAFGFGAARTLPVMKLFAIGIFSIAIFAIGYFSLRSELMAIGSLVPLFYGIYLTPARERERAAARPGARPAPRATTIDSAAEADDAPPADDTSRAPQSPGGVAGAARVAARAAAAVAATASASADALHDVAEAANSPADGQLPAVSADHVPATALAPGAGLSTWFDGKWFVHRFTATYQDTNSVGNVYFAQYMMWVGKTRELFFHTVLPEFDLKTTDFFILTRSFEHKFLRESREFESIEVRLKISDYNRKFTTLVHRVFNGAGEELGRGSQTLMFVSAQDYRLINIPEMCMKAFIGYVG